MDWWMPLLSAVVGGALATAGSVSVMLIQTKREGRRQLRDLALRMALEERAMQVDFVKTQDAKAAIYPLDVYFAHCLALMETLEKGKLTPADIKRLRTDIDQLTASLDELSPPPAGW